VKSEPEGVRKSKTGTEQALARSSE
jgi:hypothetical protein